MIIAIVGMCGSGKSEVASYLQRRGILGVYFGQITIDRLQELDLPLNLANEKKVRENLRQEHGMSCFAILSLKKINTLLNQEENKYIYIDGLYSTEEYEVLENEFRNVVLVEVYVDKLIRYQRLERRSHRPLTFQESHQRDWEEIKNLNKGGPIAISDYKINNNNSKEELYCNIDLTLGKIQQSKVLLNKLIDI